MTRSLVWDQVDAARSGIVPGTFDAGFGFAAYERWMEGVAPILFASDEGVTFSCGADGCERVLEEREVTEGEASRLLETALPDARWNGTLELRSADSLPPRLAAGYAALAKGIFGSPESLAAARTLLGLADADEQAVRSAWNNLRAFGWQARIYGRPIGQVADELAAIASRSLPLREERQLLDGLAQLWMVRMVPRDALLSKWKATRVPTPEEQAVELYGEGAVIPYDELAGEPPAGSTSVMRLDQLRQA